MFGKRKDLAVRSGNGGGTGLWDPFEEFKDLRSSVSELFDEFMLGHRPLSSYPAESGRTWIPAMDVEEDDDRYTFSAEIPGVDKNDLRVEVQDGVLTLSAERKEETKDESKGVVRREQRYGTFMRSFTLPADADAEKIKASYKNGIVKLTVPRTEKAKPKAIKVDLE